MDNPWYASKWGDWKAEKHIINFAEYYNVIGNAPNNVPELFLKAVIFEASILKRKKPNYFKSFFSTVLFKMHKLGEFKH